MPTVLRKDGFDFMIYTLDHQPSHTHVWKAGKEVVINLGDENRAPYVRDNNGMGNKDKKKSLKITAENQEFLIAEWERIHGGS